MKIKRGSTSVRRLIFVADSSSTVGAGLANLAYNTSSLVAYYFAGDLSNEVQITLATATLGTWTSGGFVAVDNTNMPGWYEIGIPNAALDGGNECAIQLSGAANMVPVNIYIELDSFDYQTATQPVNVTQFGGTNGTFSSGIPTAALDSTRQQALADLAAMITASGTADAKFDAVALSLAPGGGALTGPFTRTITVTDAADDAPIEAANVRLYRTGETETKPTDADGEASFTTEAATFSYAVTANGYGGVSGTIVISADGATTIELTATAVTPPTDPALSAIEVLCLNANFAAASGIDVDFRMSAVATGDQNRAHPGAKKTVTSNVSGIARFEGPQGATIEWKRGTGQVWASVALDNDSVTNVTSLIGSP